MKDFNLSVTVVSRAADAADIKPRDKTFWIYMSLIALYEKIRVKTHLT